MPTGDWACADSWPLDDAAGSVTIAVGWNWHQLLSVGASDEWPWVGVRLGVAEGADGREPWAGLLATTTQLQPRAGDDLRRADSCPLLRPVRDGGSTDELAAACLRELQSFWTEYGDAVDDWLAAGATSDPWQAA